MKSSVDEYFKSRHFHLLEEKLKELVKENGEDTQKILQIVLNTNFKEIGERAPQIEKIAKENAKKASFGNIKNKYTLKIKLLKA